MKLSIREKLLMMCILLVLLTTIGISVTYYVMIRQDKRQEFQQRIQIAFDIILNDIDARLTNTTNRVKEFLTSDTLAVTTSRYIQDEQRLRSISFITTNLAKAADEINRFGHVNVAQRVILYGVNKRLLAIYQQDEQRESTGVYVISSDGKDLYLPADDATQLTSMLLGRTPIPEMQLPPDVSASFPDEFPKALSAKLFSQNQRFGIRILAPIQFQDTLAGALLVETYYPQSLVDRYASLSQTEVNLFAGNQLSIGTLAGQTTLAAAPLVSCDDVLHKQTAMTIFPVTLAKSDYYQGQCAFKEQQNTIGAVSISLSQESAKQAIRKVLIAVLSIAGIIFGVTFGFSWMFSRKLARPITIVATLIHRIAHGDLSGVFAQQFDGDIPTSAEKPMAHTNSELAELPAEDESGYDEIAMLTHSFYDMARYLRDMAMIASNISRGEVVQTFAPRSDRDTLGLAFQHMLAYIHNMTELTRAIADGDLLVDVQPRSDQDLLSHSLRKMIGYIQGVAGVAETISEGNLQVHVQPKSEQDVLNQALQRMVEYIQAVANVTEKVSHNDLQVMVAPRSPQDILNRSLQQMITNLNTARENAEHSMAEVERQNWIRTGQAELSNVMRGEQDVALLAKQVITYLAEYLQAQVGLLYVTETNNGTPFLQLAGSYAYTTRKGNRNEFTLGEGLVGQAALERESLLFSDIPEDYLTIISGIVEIKPRNILVTPFIYEGEVKGVIELATMHTFTDQHREFLNRACENIAIAFHTAQSRVKMQLLLTETQRQSHVLQTQQEELQRSNAELAEQTRALQVSEAKLQNQQEELRQSNLALQDQAEALKASEEKLQHQQAELLQRNKELANQAQILEHQRQALAEKNLELENARTVVEEKVQALELANKYKSEFLANMSHELRTPLNSVLILSKLLDENKEGNLTEKQLKSTHTIYQAVTSWIARIDDILNLSEIEMGKLSLNIQELETRFLTDYLEQNFRARAAAKGLTFTIEVADDVPRALYTDPKRVEQVVENLVSNALKFTEQGSVRVRLARPAAGSRFSQSDLLPHQTIAIAITDTGIGIPQDKQQAIFEAFQQVDGSTTRKYGGTGLGLSISQQLAKLLGGEIHLQSVEGKGSTFTLYLPERQGRRSAAETTRSVEFSVPMRSVGTRKVLQPGDNSAQISSSFRKILVVEDYESMQISIRELLTNHAMAVTTVSTGHEAYMRLQNEAFDAVVLDLGLADMPGVTLLQQIRNDTALAQLPVIIYTAKELTPEEERRLRKDTESIIIKGEKAQERLLDEMVALLDHKTSTPPQPEMIRAPDASGQLRGKHILVVDDDMRNLYAISNVLEEQGISVLLGSNGKEALRMLTEHPDIDLLLMDIMMPEMDGCETIRAIRQQPQFQPLPIIVLTAKTLKHDQEECLAAGANEYLAKPIDTDILLALLQRWLVK